MNKQSSVINADKKSVSVYDFLRKVFRDYLVIVAIVLLVLITIIVEPKVISIQNITNIMSQLGALSLMSLSMTIAIIGGFVDLSVAGIINLVAVITIGLIQPLGQIPALLVGLGLGALLGWINSLLLISGGAVTLFESMFITYGLSSVYSALALIICKGETQQMFFITKDVSVFNAIGSGNIGIFSVPVLIFVVFLVLLHLFQSRTYRGRSIALIGGNKTAANLAGIPVKQSIMLIFTISGFMAGLVAIVLFSRIGKASPIIGTGYDLNAILAVVVGGTTMKGGKGSVLRTLLGVLLITLLSNCLDLLGVSTYLKVVLSGAILVLAIWLDNRKELRGEYK